MTDREMDGSLGRLAPYELSWAPAAATYLTLLVMVLPLAAFGAVRRHRRSLFRRDLIEVELGQLAAASGLDPPPRAPVSAGPAFRSALLFVGGATALPLLIIAIELAVH
jgi:hypothetical protein